MARAIMVQGTSSGAGKSVIATAICRYLARRGMRVAPFKAQNLSNHSRVCKGGEIGASQHFQALAAGVEPDTRMNPVLIKPEHDGRSEVVLNGRPDRALSARPWRERADALWPVVSDSLLSLMREFEVIVLEGAGSPAEINLTDWDLANGRCAELADATVLLVGDLDRGGAFAHLYGTWSLLEPAARKRIAGFVLNKARGASQTLESGIAQIRELTGVPVIGVVPWLEHRLPEEDGLIPSVVGKTRNQRPTVAIVRYPSASNLDEFEPLADVADLIWAARPEQVVNAALAILPGSKVVAADLDWLRNTGCADAISARARAGLPTLAICGGLQMLGIELADQDGVDGTRQALGLLPLRTTFAEPKLTTPLEGVTLRATPPWDALDGLEIRGYEIRYGRTTATAPLTEALDGGRGWVSGSILGLTVHGIFENAAVVEALFGAEVVPIDASIDEVCDGVLASIDLAEVWPRDGHA